MARQRQPHDRPHMNRFPVIRALALEADADIAAGLMLSENRAKAYFVREVDDAAHRQGVAFPFSPVRMVHEEGVWWIVNAEFDDAGRRLVKRVTALPDGRQVKDIDPDFLSWGDLMDRDGPYVLLIGVEAAREIADMLVFDETLVGVRCPHSGKPADQRRIVCLKRLFGESYDEDPFHSHAEQESAEEAKARWQQKLASLAQYKTRAFDTADMSSPIMTEPPEVFQRHLADIGANAVDQFLGVGK